MKEQELSQLLEQEYLVNGRFQHRLADRIRILPYVTHSPPPAAEQELTSWLGLSGEAARFLTKTHVREDVSPGILAAKMKNLVSTDRLQDLQDVVEKVVFDREGKLLPFNVSVFKYLPLNKNKTLRRLGHFTGDVFLDAARIASCAKFDDTPGNVLYQLVSESLPELEHGRKDAAGRFFVVDTGLTEPFAKDWEFMWQQKDRVRSHLPELLKFYAFQYQMRLVEKLDAFFSQETLEPLYFTLDWEKCSIGRKSYVAGWKRIEPKIRRIFSHVNCLEMLNIITAEGLDAPYDYQGLNYWLKTAAPDARSEYGAKLDTLVEFYRKQIANLGFGWQEHEDKLEPREWNDAILNRVHHFWLMIDCQFRYSHRNAPAGRYANWISVPAIRNFGKRRGRIGNTLSLNREQLMLLAWLAVGTRPKLRLHEFWEELRERGVDFDHQSKVLIVELLEKLNLLEKKSDSGDAQYVRAII